MIEDDDYDFDKDTVCSTGIHFYLTRDRAYLHNKSIQNGVYREWFVNGELCLQHSVVNRKIEGEYIGWHKDTAQM